MNNDNELQRLLKNLDSIVDKINQEFLSTPNNPRQGTSFLSSKFSISSHYRKDTSALLTKINTYKNLRNKPESHNKELVVFSLMEIFSDTESLIKKISAGDCVSEYIDKGFFKRFSDISGEVKRLIA